MKGRPLARLAYSKDHPASRTEIAVQGTECPQSARPRCSTLVTMCDRALIEWLAYFRNDPKK